MITNEISVQVGSEDLKHRLLLCIKNNLLLHSAWCLVGFVPRQTLNNKVTSLSVKRIHTKVHVTIKVGI